jgi:hypothetical protein
MRAFLRELRADFRFAQANPELLLLVVVAAVAIFTSACSALPDPSTGKKNACLPEAAMMTEALNAKGIESKVLLLQTTKFNHAISVYLYESKLFGWDSNWKSVRLRAYFNDPEGVAREWLRKTTFEPETLRKAEYL